MVSRGKVDLYWPPQAFSERLQLLWGRLQGTVNVVMDSSQEKKKAMPNGIKQVLASLLRVSENHNSLGCKQLTALMPSPITQCTGHVPANTRGDRNVGHYVPCTCNTDDWP